MVYIAVLGHGIVGSGVAEVLAENSGAIAGRSGEEIAVKYILDKRDFPDSPYADKFVKDFDIILRDKSVKVIVEVMGGVHPAYDFVKAGLEAGKSAVTSNKEMVAQKGAELLAIAREHNVNFMFEASVGGGIPVIRPMHECLAANVIEEVAGILNGTTNFMLTKMISDGMSFAGALELARQKGYAEADPSADLEGHDACRKICILASLAFGEQVYPECVRTRGITGLSSEDIMYAEGEGRVVKLIGRAVRAEGGKVFATVCPAMLPSDSLLAGVNGVFNGILVRGNAVGDVIFYGRGAGKRPTASAVIGDVAECVRADGTVASLWWADSGRDNVADYREQSAVFYARCLGSREVAEELLGGGVRFLSRDGQPEGEIAFITGMMPEGRFEELCRELGSKGVDTQYSMPLMDY